MPREAGSSAQSDRAKILQSMKVRCHSPEGEEGQVSPVLAFAVHGIGIAPNRRYRTMVSWDSGHSLPPIARDAGGVVNGGQRPRNLPPSFEEKHQIMTVRAELQLQVAVVFHYEEQLHHLVLPQAVPGAGRARRRGIVMERGVNRDRKSLVRPNVEDDVLVRRERSTIPGR